MFEIEMPCCGTTGWLDETANAVECEHCNVILELDVPAPEALPAAA
jgi:hypothetical protein